MDLVDISLIVLLIMILVLPTLSRRIERNLEIFFLIMASVAASATSIWSREIIEEAFLAPITIKGLPIGIFQVVVVASILFGVYSDKIDLFMEKLSTKIPISITVALLVFLLGIGSSLISVIVSSVIMSEIAFHLRLRREILRHILIVSAYSIGVGAALTPVGEPLATIAIYKLSGPPYHADFFFLFRLLGIYIIPLITAYSIYAGLYVSIKKRGGVIETMMINEISEKKNLRETLKISLERGLRIYAFIFALTILGASYNILVDRYIKYFSPELMYLFGSISAVVDNATLTAAIISSELSILQIKSFLISLLIAGGFLIPGNVPNIVMTNIHKIRYIEWAKEAIPLGLPSFIAMYIIFFIFGL